MARGTGAGTGEPSWGAWVVITGLVVILIAFVVAVVHYDTATQVTTAIGSVSGVVAALVGAYFGVRGTYTAQKIAAGITQREQEAAQQAATRDR